MTDLSAGLGASVSSGPIAGSTKIYRDLDGAPRTRVPFRRVNLSNGEHLDLYDTSDCGRDRSPTPTMPPSSPNCARWVS